VVMPSKIELRQNPLLKKCSARFHAIDKPHIPMTVENQETGKFLRRDSAVFIMDFFI